MEKFINIIRSSQLFSGISEDEITAMLSCLEAKKVKYDKGEFIMRQGDSVEEIGLVLDGTALVIQEDIWGNRNILSRAGAGEAFAVSFACAPGAVLNVSVAAEESSEILFLNVKRILTVCTATCSHHNRIIRNLLGELAEKNLMHNEKITLLGQRTTRAKLISYFSSEAKRTGKYEFDIPFSRQQLADYLAVERSGLSAELGKMKKEGLIDFNKNHFVIHV